MLEINKTEIRKAIHGAVPKKQPGEDGIPNEILHWALDIILEPLEKVFNASFQLGHYPSQFRKSVTIALRKPGKETYADPKSYLPIALLNTIGKALESILATRIS